MKFLVPWCLAPLLLLSPLAPSAGAQSAAPWSERSYLIGTETHNASSLGRSVALDADLAAVGAPGADGVEPSSGVVFLFERRGSSWVQIDELFAPDGERGAQFGYSVALEGSTLVVGAFADRRLGSAYVFERNKNGWRLARKLTPAFRPDFADAFGGSVAISGSTIVVGADGSRYVGPRFPCFGGSAHVFERDASGWHETATLLDPNGRCLDNFGSSVAIDADEIVVGALAANPPVRAGAAFVFRRTSSGWSFDQELLADTPHRQQSFGSSIAILAGRIVVGAPQTIHPCASGSSCAGGAVYIFEEQGGSYALKQVLAPLSALPFDFFGSFVDIDGDRLAVGSMQGDGLVPDSGTVSVYTFDGSIWSSEQVLSATNAKPADAFSTVALAGDDLVVGAFRSSPHGKASGSAYFFRRNSARVRFRNGGANPASYHASKPILGSTWTASVDVGGTGHAFAALLVGFEAAPRRLPGGQVQLVEAPSWFRLPLQQGPTARWSLRVPTDPTLAGLRISSQAAHLFGEGPFLLSNAQDLILGY